MQVNITKDSFKSQARRQHEILMERGVTTVKLSDIQESLAIAFGYRNLAHLYGAFKEEGQQEVELSAVQGWSTWVMLRTLDDDGGDVWSLLPEGSTLDDIASKDWNEARAAYDSAVPFPDGFVLSDKTTVLETWCELPAIDAYGLIAPADRLRVKQWVVEELGFRVPRDGVEVSCHDRGDDGTDIITALVAVTDEDARRIREEMFAD